MTGEQKAVGMDARLAGSMAWHWVDARDVLTASEMAFPTAVTRAEWMDEWTAAATGGMMALRTEAGMDLNWVELWVVLWASAKEDLMALKKADMLDESLDRVMAGKMAVAMAYHWGDVWVVRWAPV